MPSNGSISLFILVLAFGVLNLREAIRNDATDVVTDMLEVESDTAAADKQIVDHYMHGDGDPCTTEEQQEIWQRFKIGKAHDKMCKDQQNWGDHVEYEHPSQKDTIALYLYPSDDHNGAFGFCIGRAIKFDRVFCKRLKLASDHYSVKFWRVGSVEEAQSRVNEVVEVGQKIKHLVLGGHGAPYGLWWGDERDSCARAGACTINMEVHHPTTSTFLCHARTAMKSLDNTETASTVFLDSCLNGQRMKSGTNMVQYVSHKLAGARVLASQISFSSDQVSVYGDGEHFKAAIHEGRRQVLVEYQQEDQQSEFRHWDPYASSLCTEKDEDATDLTPYLDGGVTELHACFRACKASAACQAFVFFKIGRIWKQSVGPVATKKCYLSNNCHHVKESTQGAMTFVKKNPPDEDDALCPPFDKNV